ncbi:hypothetical protein T03_9114 [Trichinella britovi]|uniref:Uncharacterized protein n=1 Tax=Trichinella britovi TaxID=45882 RepID=A0A0V1C7N8_TRIBR|nr:hypothetical protein T03_9114 [Trichinella britovi]
MTHHKKLKNQISDNIVLLNFFTDEILMDTAFWLDGYNPEMDCKCCNKRDIAKQDKQKTYDKAGRKMLLGIKLDLTD